MPREPSYGAAVDERFAQSILDGGAGADLSYVAAAAVEHDANFFVAIRFRVDTAPEPVVGVWQSLNLKTGPVRSVDAFATEFTVWPSAGTADSPVIGEAKRCLRD